MEWTYQDELHLQKWIDEKGINLVYLPNEKEWGYFNKSKPTEINGGFKELSHLKQHLVHLMGSNKSIKIVSEGDFKHEIEKANNVIPFRKKY